ncbi:MAG: hypothetical protein M0Z94_08100 [Dehalococcoidales bacterium]|nr:hypothetical protein [Dehalococcoidales bacterium]
MDLNRFCPGAAGIRDPRPEYENCPYCGYEVEIWSDEVRVRCPQCHNLVVKGRQASCIDWCEHARECIGEEAYARLVAERGNGSG